MASFLQIEPGLFKLSMDDEALDALRTICPLEWLEPRVIASGHSYRDFTIDERDSVADIPGPRFAGVHTPDFNPMWWLNASIAISAASFIGDKGFSYAGAPAWVCTLSWMAGLVANVWVVYNLWRAWRNHCAARDKKLRIELAIRFVYQYIMILTSTYNAMSAKENYHIAGDLEVGYLETKKQLGLLQTRYDHLRSVAPESTLLNHDMLYAVDRAPPGASIN